MTSVSEYVAAHTQRLYDDLDAWLHIPSISADPANRDDVRRYAEWAAEALRKVGFTTEIWETDNDGHPAVYAERIVGEDIPTVVI